MSIVVNSAQPRLFPAVESVTVYEQPLSERMRTFLRLEYLFQSIRDGMERGNPTDARNAIVNMIDVADQLARTDIKGELIKEIERYTSTISGLRHNPAVNQSTLEHTLSRLEPILAILKSNACQPGLRLRQNEIVAQVRQRLAIPGGTCSFDLPAFHYWLHRPLTQRNAQLQDWMQDLRIIEDAVHTVLKLVRESAPSRRLAADNGFYQQQLDPATACQIVRVVVADADDLYPEISGGKHRFTIRFVRHADVNARAQVVQNTVWFELRCCSL